MLHAWNNFTNLKLINYIVKFSKIIYNYVKICNNPNNRGGNRVMVTKYLKRKIVLNGNEDYSYDIPMTLEYYLLESFLEYRNELAGQKVYGVSVIKKFDDNCLEEDSITNYSCCINKTNELVNKLADNAVTPMTLAAVIDDILGE